jgi:glutaredoxin-like protein NrdH
LKNVILYSQPECPPCEVVKLFMKEHRIEYVEKNIKDDTGAREYMMKRLKSYSTPTITVDDTVISGFDLEALKSALEI